MSARLSTSFPGVEALSQFEFVQVTIAVILGLGLTDLLRNLGEQYRHRNEFEIYWIQILASCLLLLVILRYLWIFWAASDVTWTLPLFLLQAASAVALALSTQFIKVDWNSSQSAEAQYYDNRLATYASWCLAPALAGVFVLVTGEGVMGDLARIVVIVLLTSLAISNTPRYHTLVIIALVLMLAADLAIVQPELN